MHRSDTNSDVRVSVCMPAHNARATIAQAVASIALQDVSAELILVDDCSSDDTVAAALAYEQQIPIRVIRNKTNLGAAGSRNLAVQHAKAPYVAFLDADDAWTPGKLKKQLDLLEATGAALCCTARELLTPSGEHTGRVIGVKDRITYKDLLRSNVINCSSVLLPTDTARQYPMEHEDSHEDYITWMKILRDHEFAAGINEPLLLYRLSNTGKSGSKLKSAGMTYRAYRYMGFGRIKAGMCFASYAVCGVMKYLRSYLK